MQRASTRSRMSVQSRVRLRSLSSVLTSLLAITTASHALECFCTEGSGCNNNICHVDHYKSFCELSVKYVEDNDKSLVAIHISAKCVKTPPPFTQSQSSCYGDNGTTWQDNSNLPHSAAKTYCCSNKDRCSDCPEDLLDIRGVASFLPHSCKLPDVQTEPTTSPTPVVKLPPATGVVASETDSDPTQPTGTHDNTINDQFQIVALVLTGCIVLSGGLMFVLIFSLCFKWRSVKGQDTSMKKCPSLMEEASYPFSVDYSISSSGMNGARLLQQRTLGDDIYKIRRLGRGSFGDVWLGDWMGEKVAVKVFHTRAEESWRREEEIYRTHMLTHDNILRFKTAEQRTYLDSHIELWTIFEYHQNGTLYEYLEESSLEMQDALKLCSSFIAGLYYLHKDIQAATCQAKPGIAHRDLKSRNILVKVDGSCTIADLGLAVKHDGRGGIDRIPCNKLQGTRRYMPPEILSQTMNFTSFQCYKRADIYSASLILYEILSSVKFNKDAANRHTMPYNNHLPSDPTIEEVKEVVCAGIRPDLGFLGEKQTLSASFTTLLQEGWHQDPAIRPTASYINKRVSSMQK